MEDNRQLLRAMLGAEYLRDLVDLDSICSLMSLQGEAISESVVAIESVLVTGQPGRADTVETELIVANRSKQCGRGGE